MKGIVLASHGPLAKGFFESAQMFFGKDIPQFEYITLNEGESPETFDQKLLGAIHHTDTGEGVIVLTDMMGGTPANRAVLMMDEKTEVISGTNMPLLLELLGNRQSENYDFDTLIETGRKGVIDLNKEFAETEDL